MTNCPNYNNQPDFKKVLRKRAHKKYLTNRHLFGLINNCRNSPLHKSYLTSTFCSSRLEQKDGKITSAYCNQRWCNVCNSIRTAKLIKHYGKQLENLADPYHIVLSRPTVPGEKLQDEINAYISAFQRIAKHINKYFDKLNGMRKLEITYNMQRHEYHPHFHVIVSGKEVANKIIQKWLEEFPTAKFEKGNKADKCRNGIKRDKDGLPMKDDFGNVIEIPWYMELFKYFTKLSCKTNRKEKVKRYGKEFTRYIETDVPHYALDIMLRSVSGRRVFQPLGKIIKATDEDIKVNEVVETTHTDTRTWIYETIAMDWIDPDTGELLTEYKPTNFKVQLTPSNVGYYARQHCEVMQHLKANDIKSFVKEKHVYMTIDSKGLVSILKKKRKKRKEFLEKMAYNIQGLTNET